VKVSTILAQVDLGSLALPEFQRGYVWNRDQVRGPMTALYRKHPTGSLLVWATRTDDAPIRGNQPPAPGGLVDLLLDGQQRVTSLYEPDGTLAAASAAGFRCFTDIESFREYVRSDVLALAPGAV
jgi:hypothetical protein